MHTTQCGCPACSQKPPEPRPPRPCPEMCKPPRPPVCDCRPPKAEGVLLQKIICCEKRDIPRLCTQLTLTGLCAQPPLSLGWVQQSGAQPWWTPLDGCSCASGRLPVCVSIPVCAQVCDCAGQAHHASGIVDVETYLCMPGCDLWQHSLYIVPHVRLCCAECCQEGCTFQVQLQILLEMYLLRPEPCMMRRPGPSCPDLPLYPPPIRPDRPCWPQCPAGPGPCGWPARG